MKKIQKVNVMNKIEKKSMSIDRAHIGAEKYLFALIKEAYHIGILSTKDMEMLQMQCVELAAQRCERYTLGESSSLPVEIAERIMLSNLYTIGIYLKTGLSANQAVRLLKKESIREIYEKGLKTIDTKCQSTHYVYQLMKKNKIDTPHIAYNNTICSSGIQPFFKNYNPDYEANEIPASIDYQLCNPVGDFIGIEYIQKYIEYLYFENQFCRKFDQKAIHFLLSGYDRNYKDLLINIFEHVLISALGCVLVSKNPFELTVTKNETILLQHQFEHQGKNAILDQIDLACSRLVDFLGFKNKGLKNYIQKSLPTIKASILNGIQLKTLNKVLIEAKNSETVSKIVFQTESKMTNIEYCKIIEELIQCRYFSDKVALIKDKFHALDDFEEMIFDVDLTDGEVEKIFLLLGNYEIGVFVKKYEVESKMSSRLLSENELRLQKILTHYIYELEDDLRKQIFDLASRLDIYSSKE